MDSGKIKLMKETPSQHTRRCCCCHIHVKRGAVIFGGIGAVSCTIGLIFSSIRYLATAKVYELTGFPAPQFVGTVIALYCLGLLSLVCLFIGVYNEYHTLLIPAMIMQTIGVGLLVVGIILFVSALGTMGSTFSAGLIAAWTGHSAASRAQLLDDMRGPLAHITAVATVLGFCFGVFGVTRIALIVRACYLLFRDKRRTATAKAETYDNPVFTVVTKY